MKLMKWIKSIKEGGVKEAQWGEHDIGENALDRALEHSSYPQALRELVKLSRNNFGWFTKTSSRIFEYPWIVDEIGDAENMRILDVGAGVSSLPLLLAEKGAKVTTIDNSATIRVMGQGRKHWNEWGFLDYSVLDSKITSLNENILSVKFPEESFDCIYSVSVIEHMPASVRKLIWNRFKNWLKKEGKLLLTIDLIPNTEYLWNYCEGKVVEAEDIHGNTEKLHEELSLEGFKLVKKDYIREIPSSRIDCMLLLYVKI